MLIRIYTDGACSGNPGPGGWGVVFISDKGIEKLSGSEKQTTNNRMELIAVVKALCKIRKDQRHKNNSYEIYSDSAYVINAINNNWIKNWKANGWKTVKGTEIKNKDLWVRFDKAFSGLKVKPKFIKVKGHSGNQYNEYVDKIARGEIK